MLSKETVLPTLHLKVLLLDIEGDDRRYWPPRPTQRLHGDFFATSEMPSDGRRGAR